MQSCFLFLIFNIVSGIDANSSLIQWFWDVMEEFTNQERSLFLRFVWGRTRLPRTIADFRGRDFVLQVSIMCTTYTQELGELLCERNCSLSHHVNPWKLFLSGTLPAPGAKLDVTKFQLLLHYLIFRSLVFIIKWNAFFGQSKTTKEYDASVGSKTKY